MPDLYLVLTATDPDRRYEQDSYFEFVGMFQREEDMQHAADLPGGGIRDGEHTVVVISYERNKDGQPYVTGSTTRRKKLRAGSQAKR